MQGIWDVFRANENENMQDLLELAQKQPMEVWILLALSIAGTVTTILTLWKSKDKSGALRATLEAIHTHSDPELAKNLKINYKNKGQVKAIAKEMKKLPDEILERNEDAPNK